MKKLQVAIVAVFLLCGSVSSFAQSGITNTVPDATPDIPAPVGWAYASSPGTYFWNGVWFSVGMGFLTLSVRGVRKIIHWTEPGGE